jgi:hypothetical protein
MNAMLDAMIVADKTHIPVCLWHGEVALLERIMASSQGGFM